MTLSVSLQDHTFHVTNLSMSQIELKFDQIMYRCFTALECHNICYKTKFLVIVLDCLRTARMNGEVYEARISVPYITSSNYEVFLFSKPNIRL